MKHFVKIVAISATVASSVTVMAADTVLTQIWARLDKPNFVIEGKEKGAVQTINYNDTTYVPIRYVSDTLGKEIKFNQETNTISIGTPQLNPETAIGYLEDSFIDKPMSTNWRPEKYAYSDGSWTFDGPNGMLCDGYGCLVLDNVLLDGKCNYDIEFEASPNTKNGTNTFELFYVYLGNSDGKLSDPISVTTKGIYSDNGSAEFSCEQGQFYKVKINVKDSQANIYVDGKYITSVKLLADKSAFAFRTRYSGYYIRNFKISVTS